MHMQTNNVQCNIIFILTHTYTLSHTQKHGLKEIPKFINNLSDNMGDFYYLLSILLYFLLCLQLLDYFNNICMNYHLLSMIVTCLLCPTSQ